MTGPFRHGDIVGVDIKGREFLALVEEDLPRELRVEPLTHGFGSHKTVTKRDVVGIWRHARGPVPVIKKTGAPSF